MAWLEFHAVTVKRLQKFIEFRVELNWSENEALGFLGNLWGEVLDLREDGDIRAWKPAYVVEITRAQARPDRLWKALTAPDRWVDVKEDGRVLVHDWLDYAGRFLEGRYRTANPIRLLEIWEKHGRTYEKKLPDEVWNEWRRIKDGLSQTKDGPPYRTVPNLTRPTDNGRAPSASDFSGHRLSCGKDGGLKGVYVTSLTRKTAEEALETARPGARDAAALRWWISQKEREAGTPRESAKRS